MKMRFMKNSSWFVEFGVDANARVPLWQDLEGNVEAREIEAAPHGCAEESSLPQPLRSAQACWSPNC